MSTGDSHRGWQSYHPSCVRAGKNSKIQASLPDCFYICRAVDQRLKRIYLALIFYNIFLWLFRVGTFLSAPFNQKAKLWTRGRRKIFDALENAITPGSPVIWMHCASLGEFEQGRPLIERPNTAHFLFTLRLRSEKRL
jgi:hypothetical protein